MMKSIIKILKKAHPNLSVRVYDLDCAVSTGNGIQRTTATDLAVTLLRERIFASEGQKATCYGL